MPEVCIESYIYLLCDQKKYSEAIVLCSKIKSIPQLSQIIPEVIKSSGDIDLWKKTIYSKDEILINEAIYESNRNNYAEAFMILDNLLAKKKEKIKNLLLNF